MAVGCQTLCSPLPRPARSCAPKRDDACGAACLPGWGSPSSGAVPGRDALCHALSLARLCYGDYQGTAQDPNILCWCRVEELALPWVLWQGPAISICVRETVTQPPSAHSWDNFRLGCADEGEMTGSLRIRTTRCLSQLPPPGAMGGAWASSKAPQGHGVPEAGATTIPAGKAALPVCCGCGLDGSSCWCRILPSFALWTCAASLLLREQANESPRSHWLLSLRVCASL